ncbi:MAG: hypothetical protein BA066_07080 [Candidatus Korarchaeota archaeon NZ13-K]|nr:MAG: hypothetical protein BA066_07080 [Candidatus Korarchaeota archaeon NZ13-K]
MSTAPRPRPRQSAVRSAPQAPQAGLGQPLGQADHEIMDLTARLQDQINNLLGITIGFILGYDGEEGCDTCRDFYEKADPVVREIIRLTRKLDRVARAASPQAPGQASGRAEGGGA